MPLSQSVDRSAVIGAELSEPSPRLDHETSPPLATTRIHLTSPWPAIPPSEKPGVRLPRTAGETTTHLARQASVSYGRSRRLET